MLPSPYLYTEKTVLNKACFLLRYKKSAIQERWADMRLY